MRINRLLLSFLLWLTVFPCFPQKNLPSDELLSRKWNQLEEAVRQMVNGNIQGAKSTLNSLWEKDRNTAITDSMLVADIWFQLGNVALFEFDYEEARICYQHALDYAKTNRQRVRIHQNMGCLYYLTSSYENATIHFQYAIELLREGPETDPSRMNQLCLNAGFASLELNLPGKALSWFEAMGAKSGQLPDHQEAIRLTGLGNAYLLQAKEEAALSCYRRAKKYLDTITGFKPEKIWILR